MGYVSLPEGTTYSPNAFVNGGEKCDPDPTELRGTSFNDALGSFPKNGKGHISSSRTRGLVFL